MPPRMAAGVEGKELPNDAGEKRHGDDGGQHLSGSMHRESPGSRSMKRTAFDGDGGGGQGLTSGQFATTGTNRGPGSEFLDPQMAEGSQFRVKLLGDGAVSGMSATGRARSVQHDY